jgi:hypothetical protein
MAEGCRRLHNEEFRNLYPSPNVDGVIKSRRMRLAVLVARMGAMNSVYRFFPGKPERKRPLGRLGVDGNVILEWMLGKEGGRL